MTCEQTDKVFSINSKEFETLAIETFQHQYRHNKVYQAYLGALGIDPLIVKKINQIPFLPIQFFKTHEIKSDEFEAETVFTSSGTTGSVVSKHFVRDTGLYRQSFETCFRTFYGDPCDYCILGLLPSYLERANSSLVYMVNRLMQVSGHPLNGFYLDDMQGLHNTLQELETNRQAGILFGVSFALLDFAEKYPMPFQYTTIIETGGMKGRRKELTRQELHASLKQAFGVSTIHSEYGMTELLTQAYSKGEGIFHFPPWAKMLVRDEDDPFQITDMDGGKGAVNVIDLANRHSCSFIATDDTGVIYQDGAFALLGRLDASDMRGCSLMVTTT